MRRVALLVLAALAIGTFAACAKREPEPEPAAATRATPPPAGSPLAKVQLGMSQRDVQNVLGPPDDENAYVTGKAFIPF
jgi:hypothetical protein